MHVYTFEVCIFLKTNRRFWGMDEWIQANRQDWASLEDTDDGDGNDSGDTNDEIEDDGGD